MIWLMYMTLLKDEYEYISISFNNIWVYIWCHFILISWCIIIISWRVHLQKNIDVCIRYDIGCLKNKKIFTLKYFFYCFFFLYLWWVPCTVNVFVYVSVIVNVMYSCPTWQHCMLSRGWLSRLWPDSSVPLMCLLWAVLSSTIIFLNKVLKFIYNGLHWYPILI